MATSTAETSASRLPSNPVGYVAILAAVVTGVLHLVLATQVVVFSQFLAVLFALNGLGFLGGISVYLSDYWRRELFVVAAGYALVTVLALFVFQGFSVDAFYQGGSVNPVAVISKLAEVVLAAASLYLYASE